MHLSLSRFFLFLFLTLLLNTPASASECSAKDNEYAASWDNYMARGWWVGFVRRTFASAARRVKPGTAGDGRAGTDDLSRLT